MNIEIYYNGTKYSAEYAITYNLDTGSEIHTINIDYYTMTLFNTGCTLEEVLEKVKSDLDMTP